MKKLDVWLVAALLLCVAFIFFTGCIVGYVHVIQHSEAYCIDNGDTLVMLCDGHVYQYVVSPAFYKKR